MSMTTMFRATMTRADALLDGLRSVAPLVTRLVLGQAFLLTGLGKWRHFDNTVGFYTDLGIPMPAANAAFVATVELVGGICLILGLGTRLTALLLSSTMVVALLTADAASFTSALLLRGDHGLTDVVPFVFLMLLTWLMAFGPGPLRVGALFSRRTVSRMSVETT